MGTGSYSDLSPADALVFKLLQQSGGVVSAQSLGLTAGDDLEIMGCYREQPFVLPQVDGNTTYLSLVQSFRVRVSRIGP